MNYVGPRGIPHSIFMGRVREPGEPEWLPEDRAKALEWLVFDQTRCSGCGRHHHEWQDDNGKELRDLPFAPTPVYCATCHMLEDARVEMLPSEPEAKRGWTIALERVGLDHEPPAPLHPGA